MHSALTAVETLGMKDVLLSHNEWPSMTSDCLQRILPKRVFSASDSSASSAAASSGETWDYADETEEMIDDNGLGLSASTGDVVAEATAQFVINSAAHPIPPNETEMLPKEQSASSNTHSPTVTDDSGKEVWKATLCATLSQHAKASAKKSNERLSRVRLPAVARSVITCTSSTPADDSGPTSVLRAGDFVASFFFSTAAPDSNLKKWWELGEVVSIRKTEGKRETVESVDLDAIQDEDESKEPRFEILCLWLSRAEADDASNDAERPIGFRRQEVLSHIFYPISSILKKITASDVSYHQGETQDELFFISFCTHQLVLTAFTQKCKTLDAATGSRASTRAQSAKRKPQNLDTQLVPVASAESRPVGKRSVKRRTVLNM